MRVNKLLLASMLALPIAMPASAQLEEIVVTASKRASTLQDIPIAVTVTSAETIEKAQIQDLLDVQSVVPSLRVSQLQSSRNATFIIRGFGNGSNNVGIEPSVGVFVDGVYRSRAGSAITDLPKIERVEVLSGPQNTLFGKNASAGVVSVVTPTPSGESAGFISGSFGNRNAVVVKGAYEDAINDTLSFEIGGSYNVRDGFFNNVALGTELNERDRFAVRGQLYWTPTDRFSARLIADYDEFDEQCCGVVNVFSNPLITGAINALGGQFVPDDPEAEFGFLDDDSTNEVTNTGISLQTDYEFDNFTVTSILAFRNSDNFDTQDVDFTSADLTNGNTNDIDIDTFTSEFRIASTTDGPVDWLVGGFFFDESIDQDTSVLFGPAFRPFVDAALAPLNPLLGGIAAGTPLAALVPLGPQAVLEGLSGVPIGSFNQSNSGVVDTSTLDNQSISFFASLDWHITDRLTLSGGINYTDDEKDFSITSTTTEVRGNLVIPGLVPGALLGLPVPFVPLNDLVPSFAANTIDIPNPVEDGSTSDDSTDFNITVSYDVNDNLNLYATYATGFKASSVDLLRDSAPNAADFAALSALGLVDPNSEPGLRFVEPEDAEVFEIGLKARFDRGTLNIAIFDQTLENFQSAIFNGTGFDLLNAEEQSTTGAEISFNYQATDNFSFGINATILDPVFDEFSTAAPLPQIGTTPATGFQVLTGETPAGIPELALSISGQYDFTIGGMEAFVRGDFQYESEVQVVDNIPEDIAAREVELLNMSAGIRTENGLTLTLWGRNLTDEAFLISAFPSVAQAGSISGYRNEPRTYGVTIRKDF